MKIITDLIKANILFQSYTGAIFQVEMYIKSHKRIALKLTLDGVNEVIYIIGIGCISLSGPFSFMDANLNITEICHIEGYTNTLISDSLAGFSLITSGGFSVAQGIESEYGTSLITLLSQKIIGKIKKIRIRN